MGHFQQNAGNLFFSLQSPKGNCNIKFLTNRSLLLARIYSVSTWNTPEPSNINKALQSTPILPFQGYKFFSKSMPYKCLHFTFFVNVATFVFLSFLRKNVLYTMALLLDTIFRFRDNMLSKFKLSKKIKSLIQNLKTLTSNL